VKEQQNRVFKSGFRNTHFSYILGPEGVEQFVAVPELHSDEAIDSDPLPPGQVWGVSLGTPETGPGLFRIEGTCGPGNGVKILNQPTPPPFRESVRVGEQNLYTRAKELVGDRNPREEEFSIQMRPMDSDKSGAGLGVPVLVALCGGLLGRNTRGGTIVVGALNLGGSIEMIPNTRCGSPSLQSTNRRKPCSCPYRRAGSSMTCRTICGRRSISNTTRMPPTPCSRRWWSSVTCAQRCRQGDPRLRGDKLCARGSALVAADLPIPIEI
jgi:predicted ATP-dependent Lon-type protease